MSVLGTTKSNFGFDATHPNTNKDDVAVQDTLRQATLAIRSLHKVPLIDNEEATGTPDDADHCRHQNQQAAKSSVVLGDPALALLLATNSQQVPQASEQRALTHGALLGTAHQAAHSPSASSTDFPLTVQLTVPASPSDIATEVLNFSPVHSNSAALSLGAERSQLSTGADIGNTALTGSQALSVITDQADYAPGSIATFTINGVTEGGSVAIQIADLPGAPGVNGIADVYAPFTVTDGGSGDTDGVANGVVVATWQVPGDGSATGATLQLNATSGGQTATTTFSDAPNAIVLENQKAGNPVSQWGIHGAIDGVGDSNIEGFSTNISVNHGQRIDFKINTNASHYKIDIYRLGYYGGNGARLVGSLDQTSSSIQAAPLRDAATGLVDAGNWSVSAGWNVPADAVSGVYIAKLTRLDGTTGENQIPFIVRADESHSGVVFQTSDTTWEAYNAWGGANLYYGNGPAADGRAYAVSYNRPFTTGFQTHFGEGESDSYLFSGEYPALSWLERNGYDVSYISEVDAARSGANLLNHKTFLSVGHDEYWSAEQVANVTAARDAGVNLAFLSGNEIYWKTRFAASIDASATAMRTLVSYKTTQDGAVDPSGIWTGTWRDTGLGQPVAKPENALTGQLYKVNAPQADSIEIPYQFANLRIWRNTSVATLQPGQTAVLPAGYLGFEWDAQIDKGSQPAGPSSAAFANASIGMTTRWRNTGLGLFAASRSVGERLTKSIRTTVPLIVISPMPSEKISSCMFCSWAANAI